ncbi:MAG TPA: hypothetical protein VN920_14795 [Pyrinomonadaceae bacterium]|nr:hypothetical protein [Pyrinomonadaceae bacterium]
MKQSFFAAILALAVSLLSLSAKPNGQQTKPAGTPNFTGNWKVNIEKSDFGPSPTPQSMSYKIDHHEPSLKLISTRVEDGVEDTVNLSLTTDGKESSNPVRGNEVKSKLKWEGSALWIESVTIVDGNTFGLKDKWTLSEDGKTITWLRRYTSPDGEADATYVLEKQ